MKLSATVAYVFWVAATAFLVRFELHTDDSGIVAALILVTTALLGTLHPERAWQWALMVGPAVPAADLLIGSSSHPLEVQDAWKLFAFVVAVGLVGSYLGVLLRRTGSAAADFYR